MKNFSFKQYIQSLSRSELERLQNQYINDMNEARADCNVKIATKSNTRLKQLHNELKARDAGIR